MGEGLKKIFFRPQFGLKIRGGGQAPPLDPPVQQTFNFNNTNQTSVTETLLKDLLDFRDNPQIIPI